MSGKPKPMSQIKQLLRLHQQGKGRKCIARSLEGQVGLKLILPNGTNSRRRRGLRGGSKSEQDKFSGKISGSQFIF